MILKALYDYYQRCGDLPELGMEEKQIGFLLVISKDGRFLRFEDCRIGKDQARSYLVKKHVSRSSAAVANYLYDVSSYVFGFSLKTNGKEQLCFDTFKEKIDTIYKAFPYSVEMQALVEFYKQGRDSILECLKQDPLWVDITKNLTKKYSFFSFRIEGDLQIVAEKQYLLQQDAASTSTENDEHVCLVTGSLGKPVEITTASMIPGSQACAKLVAFQVNSGYDSYGKSKCANAPISEEAEFAYTTALNTMLRKDSHNRFMVGSRTFLFWASSNNEAALQAEGGLFDLLGIQEETNDDPNAKIKQVREVFMSIYSGELHTSIEDKFYLLGLAPNSARIAVVYWQESPLKEFAEKILQHFGDMEIADSRKDKRPYAGLRSMLAAVTLGGKSSDVTPNLPEAVIKSIFQGIPYPYALYTACIRRIRAEQNLAVTRAAIIKAYLNRLKDNNKKITIMLDKENNNQGYVCGRLFAVLVKLQEDANNINSVRERYMNAASATPASVFATLLNLSTHHAEKLSEPAKIFYEKLMQEIFAKLSADGFPAHLDMQDQGRFFVGYYHQREDLFKGKKEITI